MPRVEGRRVLLRNKRLLLTRPRVARARSRGTEQVAHQKRKATVWDSLFGVVTLCLR